MFVVHGYLSWLICESLACQIAGVVAAPLTFCCQNVASAGDDEKCCPGLLPGQVCPMHHKREGTTCKMRSACGPADAALVALAGGLGGLPRSTVAVNPFAAGDVVRAFASFAIIRAHRPESPPPRA